MRLSLAGVIFVLSFDFGPPALAITNSGVEAIVAEILNSSLPDKQQLFMDFQLVFRAPSGHSSLISTRRLIEGVNRLPGHALRDFLNRKFIEDNPPNRQGFENATKNPDLYVESMRFLHSQGKLTTGQRTQFSTNLWNIFYDTILRMGAGGLIETEAKTQFEELAPKLFHQIEFQRQLALSKPESLGLTSNLIVYVEKSYTGNWIDLLTGYSKHFGPRLDFLTKGIEEQLIRLKDSKFGEDYDLAYKLNIHKFLFPDDHKLFGLVYKSATELNQTTTHGKTLIAEIRYVLKEIHLMVASQKASDPVVLYFQDISAEFVRDLRLSPQILSEATPEELVDLPDIPSVLEMVADATSDPDFFMNFPRLKVSMFATILSLAQYDVALNFRFVNPNLGQKINLALRRLSNIELHSMMPEEQAREIVSIITATQADLCKVPLAKGRLPKPKRRTQ